MKIFGLGLVIVLVFGLIYICYDFIENKTFTFRSYLAIFVMICLSGGYLILID